MLKTERILVPVDFSESARSAMTYAVFLADKFNAHIDVLYVWKPPELAGDDVQVFNRGLEGTSLKTYMQEQATKEITDFLKPFSANDRLSKKARIEAGDPATTIVNIAREQKYDLIVMGTHGRVGLSHLLVGSVAEKVVRLAPCPVLTYRVPEHVG